MIVGLVSFCVYACCISCGQNTISCSLSLSLPLSLFLSLPLSLSLFIHLSPPNLSPIQYLIPIDTLPKSICSAIYHFISVHCSVMVHVIEMHSGIVFLLCKLLFRFVCCCPIKLLGTTTTKIPLHNNRGILPTNRLHPFLDRNAI